LPPPPPPPPSSTDDSQEIWCGALPGGGASVLRRAARRGRGAGATGRSAGEGDAREPSPCTARRPATAAACRPAPRIRLHPRVKLNARCCILRVSRSPRASSECLNRLISIRNFSAMRGRASWQASGTGPLARARVRARTRRVCVCVWVRACVRACVCGCVCGRFMRARSWRPWATQAAPRFRSAVPPSAWCPAAPHPPDTEPVLMRGARRAERGQWWSSGPDGRQHGGAGAPSVEVALGVSHNASSIEFKPNALLGGHIHAASKNNHFGKLQGKRPVVVEEKPYMYRRNRLPEDDQEQAPGSKAGGRGGGGGRQYMQGAQGAQGVRMARAGRAGRGAFRVARMRASRSKRAETWGPQG
jgi:hypothetical protein